jgi:hypothetical protein
LSCARAGVYTASQFFSNLAGYHRHLTVQPAYDRVSAADSSLTTYLNHAKYAGRVNNSIDYYDKGMLSRSGSTRRCGPRWSRGRWIEPSRLFMSGSSASARSTPVTRPRTCWTSSGRCTHLCARSSPRRWSTRGPAHPGAARSARLRGGAFALSLPGPRVPGQGGQLDRWRA